MKSYREELWFNTPGRRTFVNISQQVEQCLKRSGIKKGLAPVKATEFFHGHSVVLVD